MIGCTDAKVQQYLTVMNEANLSEFSMQLGMLGEVYDGSDVKWVFTGDRSINRVLDARFSDEDAEDRISEILEMFESRGVRPHWITSPSTTPSDIPERLERRGFDYLQWCGMAADLIDLPDSIPWPDGLAVREVTNRALIRPWCEIVCRGFGWPDSVHESIYELFSSLGVCSVIPWKHYIGYLYDEPTSACTIFEGSGSLGVYMVAVVPGARRQGIGVATTWKALKSARDMGHRVAVLQASPMGKGVYEKIGFEEHCKMALYMPARA